ncbi:retrovirus-related pol polyprotein from transposon TNT 1-94 [Tanacetum coccineum]|uniref:Retrovirus-related pol polyprotein from transposon TNT 1-94 n=1 Tax=Tanacetum coccineum TaxID=301880 RepID=A0ABQ5BU09_9ASTR
MNSVDMSPPNIRQIDALPTRRTSTQIFNHSIDGILTAVEGLINHGVPLDPQAADLARNAGKARFAFETLHQRIQVRKFPVNIIELFPYLGLPIEEVSDALGVTVKLLKKRCSDMGIMWPRGSSVTSLLVVVQFTNMVRRFNGRRFRINRNSNFQVVRHTVVPAAVAAQGQTELHVEIDGVRFGPLLTDHQWQEVVNHPYNQHRINLLAVILGGFCSFHGLPVLIWTFVTYGVLSVPLWDSLDDYQEYKTPNRVRDQLWMMIKFRMDHGICLHMYLFWNMSFDYRFRQVFVLFFPCHVFSHWVLHDEVFKEANLFRLLLGHFLCLKVKNGSWNELLKLLAVEEL